MKGDNMSVLDVDKIDGAGLVSKGDGIALLISDHLNWDNEYQHLMTLQEKINNYIIFCESRQYNKIYPEQYIRFAIIEIYFLYEPTIKCIEFLQQVQNQVQELGIKIDCYIDNI